MVGLTASDEAGERCETTVIRARCSTQQAKMSLACDRAGSQSSSGCQRSVDEVGGARRELLAGIPRRPGSRRAKVTSAPATSTFLKMAPTPVPSTHQAKVASLALDHPVPVASSDSHSKKKRRLDDSAAGAAAATSDDGDAQDGADQAGAAAGSAEADKELSKLEKGRAKKRRKEEQRALVRALAHSSLLHPPRADALCGSRRRTRRASRSTRADSRADAWSRSRCAARFWLSCALADTLSLSPAGHPRLCPAPPRERQGAAMALRQSAHARGCPLALMQPAHTENTRRTAATSAVSSASWRRASSPQTSASRSPRSRPTSPSRCAPRPRASRARSR